MLSYIDYYPLDSGLVSIPKTKKLPNGPSPPIRGQTVVGSFAWGARHWTPINEASLPHRVQSMNCANLDDPVIVDISRLGATAREAAPAALVIYWARMAVDCLFASPRDDPMRVP